MIWSITLNRFRSDAVTFIAVAASAARDESCHRIDADASGEATV